LLNIVIIIKLWFSAAFYPTTTSGFLEIDGDVSHYRNQTVSLIPQGIMSKNVDASHTGHYTRNEPK